jgi:hypothetical protein
LLQIIQIIPIISQLCCWFTWVFFFSWFITPKYRSITIPCYKKQR